MSNQVEVQNSAKVNTRLVELTHCESEIEAADKVIKAGFKRKGTALGQIRDQRLYTETHATFEKYCSERWKMSYQRAYQLIEAGKAAKNIEDSSTRVEENAPSSSVTPTSEYQVRPLAGLPPEQQHEAWGNAVEQANGTSPSNKQVQAAVDDLLSENPEVDDLLDESSEVDAEIEEFFNEEPAPVVTQQPAQPAPTVTDSVANPTIEAIVNPVAQPAPAAVDELLDDGSETGEGSGTEGESTEVPTIVIIPSKPKAPAKPTFNQTNDMVSWAKWTWNPVTGCKHDCDYCYARDIANRFYPEKFEPTFHPERLSAPHNTKPPGLVKSLTDPIEITAWKNCFVCSMADLFGRWVPEEQIEAVFQACRENPQWNYLFLTKFPNRYPGLDFPPNSWVGTSVDYQIRVANAEKAFSELDHPNIVVKWLSLEPMMERQQYRDLSVFDWVVIGGASKSTKTSEFFPEREWVHEIIGEAIKAGCKVYCKPNTDPDGAWHKLYHDYPDAFVNQVVSVGEESVDEQA